MPVMEMSGKGWAKRPVVLTVVSVSVATVVLTMGGSSPRHAAVARGAAPQETTEAAGSEWLHRAVDLMPHRGIPATVHDLFRHH